jgi:glycosyltransferase involved in cell wall biosynthesis
MDSTLTPLFSIIVPTYNRPVLLRDALRSVMSQTIRDFECLVVDDASPRPVDQINDDRFKVIRRDENGGPAAAFNTGLSRARGEFVAFLGDDDLFTSDRLEIALAGLQRSPISLCLAGFLGERRYGGRVLNGHIHDVILDGLVPSLGATAIRRDVAERFDERFTAQQDVEWWIRVSRNLQVSTIQRVGYLVRRHSGPRHLNGAVERIECIRLMMDVHSEYFRTHRRAAAFRWRRIGLLARSLGDSKLARSAFARSIATYPSPASGWHLVRAVASTDRRVSQ